MAKRRADNGGLPERINSFFQKIFGKHFERSDSHESVNRQIYLLVATRRAYASTLAFF